MSDGGVRFEDPGGFPECGPKLLQLRQDGGKLGVGDVALHAPNAVDRVDDPATGRLFEDVEDLLAHPPAMHEEILEAECVGAQAEPEQMALDAGDLGPDEAQPAGSLGHLDVHDALERDAVTHAVHEATDAADALDYKAHLGVFDPFDHHFQAAVDVADGRDGVHDLLIHEDEVKHDRLGQDWVLRPEGDNGSLHECFTAAARVASRRALTAACEKGTRVAVL